MKTTILVVEDEEFSRDMLSRRLAREGYRVLTATNGKDGVARAAKERPDLIVMDITMPLMNGWDATTKIKKNPKSAHIPVVALTARTSVADFDRCIEVGCDAYEAKPLDLKRLLGKIRNLL